MAATWTPQTRFYKGENKLLYFKDADHRSKLCTPKEKKWGVITKAYEDVMEMAHVGSEKLWNRLTQRWYWKRMKKDIKSFCDSCDMSKDQATELYKVWLPDSKSNTVQTLWVNIFSSDHQPSEIQKVHSDSSSCWQINQVHSVPSDDKQTDHRRICGVVHNSIFCDHDTRWANMFWREVMKWLHTHVVLASTHHSQIDRKTEIVNQFLEMMLRTYTGNKRDTWAQWLNLLEFAYNSAVHSMIGYSSFKLFLRLKPHSPLDHLLETKREEWVFRSGWSWSILGRTLYAQEKCTSCHS